jgi:hypothetical protein
MVRPAGDGRNGKFSVMLLNCSELNWEIDEIVNSLDRGELTYEQLMYEMKVAPSIGKSIPSDWNCLERFDNSTCLLHYTDMNTQPWVSLNNPLGELWMKALERAVSENFISYSDVQREIVAGHVRPSLLNHLQLGKLGVRKLPKSVKALDVGYCAPYRKLNIFSARTWASQLGFLKIVKHFLNRKGHSGG